MSSIPTHSSGSAKKQAPTQQGTGRPKHGRPSPASVMAW
nr:MAG TPA: 50S ribosomal protein L2 [Caudoviricetes sp.]